MDGVEISESTVQEVRDDISGALVSVGIITRKVSRFPGHFSSHDAHKLPLQTFCLNFHLHLFRNAFGRVQHTSHMHIHLMTFFNRKTTHMQFTKEWDFCHRFKKGSFLSFSLLTTKKMQASFENHSKCSTPSTFMIM